MFEPVIKWSGSKRSQAAEILKYFPRKIDTYYEPFCGGASMLRRLIASEIKVKQYICSDKNEDLIDLWNTIMLYPETVIKVYTEMWNEFNTDVDIERKKNYYYTVRDRFNKERSPYDFMFIMRTTANGLPRYNAKREFNNSLHLSRNGILPSALSEIVWDWHDALVANNVEFRGCDFTDIIPKKNDFMYLDPPYAQTRGMYFGNFDNEMLWQWLHTCDCAYLLSYDGISGKLDNTYNVPEDLYDKHEYLCSGNSSFKRVLGKCTHAVVYESLYIKE